jgi:O-acetyl-ADP-ribose deacetylase (regulator of RNase III)
MLGLRHYRRCQIDLWQGDITTFACDVMGNAANASLSGGGGVDGRIHDVGGPNLMEECRVFGGCPTGECRPTGAGLLPARHVLHAVGPIYPDDPGAAPKLLHNAYDAMFQWCHAARLRHLATPALSCGVYGYPWPEAARVAMTALRQRLDHLPEDPWPTQGLRRVTFVLFKTELYDVFQEALFETFPEPSQ